MMGQEGRKRKNRRLWNSGGIEVKTVQRTRRSRCKEGDGMRCSALLKERRTTARVDGGSVSIYGRLYNTPRGSSGAFQWLVLWCLQFFRNALPQKPCCISVLKIIYKKKEQKVAESGATSMNPLDFSSILSFFWFYIHFIQDKVDKKKSGEENDGSRRKEEKE